jgi:hypothetical protein
LAEAAVIEPEPKLKMLEVVVGALEEGDEAEIKAEEEAPKLNREGAEDAAPEVVVEAPNVNNDPAGAAGAVLVAEPKEKAGVEAAAVWLSAAGPEVTAGVEAVGKSPLARAGAVVAVDPNMNEVDVVAFVADAAEWPWKLKNGL